MLFGTKYDPPEYAAYPGHPTDRTLANYFQQTTLGKVDIVTVNMPSNTGWLHMEKPYSYYCKGDGIHDYGMGPYPENAQGLVVAAIKAADARGVDFSQYAEDGVADVFVVHAGTGAEWSTDPNVIWSHSWAIDSVFRDRPRRRLRDRRREGGQLRDDVRGRWRPHRLSGRSVRTVSADRRRVRARARPRGRAARPVRLRLRVPRDRHVQPHGQRQLEPVLSRRDLQRRLTRSPRRLEQVPPRTHQADGREDDYRRDHEAGGNGLGRLQDDRAGIDGKEYFLFENRQNIGFDEGLQFYYNPTPDSTEVATLPIHGMTVYHVDDNVFTLDYGRPNEAENWKEFRSQGWRKAPNGATHYAISVIQADDWWDLEHGWNSGDPGDTYPGWWNVTRLGNKTLPNTSSYYFWLGNLPRFGYSGVTASNIKETGVNVTATLSVQPVR